MIVSIAQPAYLPWLGYFHRIALSNRHVVFDSVQFEKNSFSNRNRIKAASGPQWLTIPVRTKGSFGNLRIRTLEIDRSTRWRAKHWDSLRQCYGKCPFFADHAGFLEEYYGTDWGRLSDACQAMTQYLLGAFRISTPLSYSTDIPCEGKKDALVLELCQRLGATMYLSGPLGRDYLRLPLFEQAGIRVHFHDYRIRPYPQRYGAFAPFLSAIDLLFNLGPESGNFLCQHQDELP